MEYQDNFTIQSYSGRPGCMCGCLGKYTTNERTRKNKFLKLIKDGDVEMDTWEPNEGEAGCLFVEGETRNNVVYLTEAGVAAARTVLNDSQINET